MKRVLGLLLAILLLPSFGLAQAPPFVRNNSATTSINGANLTPGSAAVSVEGRLFTDDVARTSATATQPTVTNATSFTCAAANASRRMLTIQNNSAANIMISLTGATLTGIVPTSTNIGFVLTAGSSYTCPAQWCTSTAVTCYQTSGGSINTISVIEG
jgi:hypothetical protein